MLGHLIKSRHRLRYCGAASRAFPTKTIASTDILVAAQCSTVSQLRNVVRPFVGAHEPVNNRWKSAVWTLDMTANSWHGAVFPVLFADSFCG